ncbi:MAG: motility protein A [Lachnospiraceae bacterium]|nr:motility protein A [Lachnospiraceae bacterium]
MDIASLAGLLLAIIFVFISISLGDAGVASVKGFLDAPSAMITFGGALAACLVMSDDIKAFVGGLKSITLIFKPVNYKEEDIIKQIIDLSNVARKEGLLALEEAANNSIEDAFMKKGVLLIVDGTDPEFVRSILETELMCIGDRHKSNIGFWENLGGMGPAWGMIGTLVGLINMLGNLSDINAVGPNMAIALITTFYGSLLANWICTPTSNKLKSNSVKEITAKTIAVEGLLSIQAGENPRIIEEKLKSFISPERRAAISENGGGEGGGE